MGDASILRRCLPEYCYPALSLGYGAQWVTEWYSYNDAMLEALGGNTDTDQMAGFIYIGQPAEPPKPRRRPEYDDVVSTYTV